MGIVIAPSGPILMHRPASAGSAEGFRAWVPRSLLSVWLVSALFLLVVSLPQIRSFQAHDPDDYMRLLQVRDWLDGQGWYDTRQYRMNPPLGADIHWVRLGDMPIAALLFPLRFVLAPPVAEIVAMIAMPLIELLIAMALMRNLLRALGASQAVELAALVMLPLFPLLMGNFLPLRIDYHGWQAISALAMACLLARGGARRALAAGAVGATWLTLSLEGMAFVLGGAGWLALRFVLAGRREHEAFFVGLTAASVLETLAFRPPHDFLHPYCDVLSWPHLLAFALAAALLPALRLAVGPATPTRRLFILAPVPLLAAAAIVLPLGACAISPLANVDPLARAAYFDLFGEALPVTAQSFSVMVMLIATLAVTSAGGIVALSEHQESDQRLRWSLCLFLALWAGGISLIVMRAEIVAQLLAVPFSAVLVARYLPRAQAIASTPRRIATTLACLGLSTPILPTAAATPFDQPDRFARAARPFLTSRLRCDYSRLAALPPSQLFTPIGIAPQVMAVSSHRTIAGTYHRNGRQIADVFRAFAGPLDRSRGILSGYGTDYVMVCVSDIEVAYLASRRRGNLAGLLIRGRPPRWLAPVAGFTQSPLRVYRLARWARPE